MSNEHERIAILDFGSQYTRLIARRVRELGVYSEILPCDAEVGPSGAHLRGVILSGGPDSVYRSEAPIPKSGLFDLSVPADMRGRVIDG